MKTLSRFQLNREDYIRPEYVPLPSPCDGVAVYGTPEGVTPVYGVAFTGKAARPSWHLRFRRPEDRDARIAELAAIVARAQEQKERRAQERRNYRHSLQVGDVLHASWGYEQTNCDFYEVVALAGATQVDIRPIASRTVADGGTGNGMSSFETACRGQYTGPALRKRVAFPGEVVLTSYSHAYPWDGRPCYCSWYG